MTLSNSRIEHFFSLWLLFGLLLYVCGFFLAPSSKSQYLTLYIGLILPTLYFSFFHFRSYYLSNNRRLLWLLLVLVLLYLPSAWVATDVVDTLRKNLKGVLLVLSLALAVYHLSCRWPNIYQALPTLLLASSITALALYFVAFSQSGQLPHGTPGLGNLADNPNEAGLALSVGLLLLTVHLIKKPSAIGALVVIPFLFAIYFAYSRSAMLALAVALPFAVLFELGKSRLACLWMLTVAFTGIIILLLMAGGMLNADRLLTHRPSLWMEFLDKNPGFHWLWGAGLSGSITIFSETLNQKLEPHSLYFALVLRGGLISLGLFICLVIASVRQHGKKPSTGSIWLYILLFGLTAQCFEGVYPVRPPNSFWLYTWLPLLMLFLTCKPKSGRPDAAQ